MNQKELKELYQYLRSGDPKPPKVAVVGDLMLDEHITCDVLGISPEDDLAWKLRPLSSHYSLGGAANVAMNLRSMGADVLIAGAVGCDVTGMQLTTMFEPLDRITLKIPCEKSRKTTQKTRYMTRNGRHIVRVDEETNQSIALETVKMLLDGLREFRPDFVVVSDYDKGTITEELMEGLIQQGVNFAVDPKAVFEFYGTPYGAPYILTPNEKELVTYLGYPGSTVEGCMARLYNHDVGQHILVKRAGEGAQLWVRTVSSSSHSANPSGVIEYVMAHEFRAHKRSHGDPAGCGDSLMAGLAYGLALGWDVGDAVKLGVAAGSVAFDATGVRVVEPAQLIAELSRGEANV